MKLLLGTRLLWSCLCDVLLCLTVVLEFLKGNRKQKHQEPNCVRKSQVNR